MEEASVKKQHAWLSECLDWISVMIGALILSIVIFTLLFRIVTVDGDSMMETLHHNDRVILVTEFYSLDRGDIVVVARQDGTSVIKRVIAIAGDTLDIDEDGKVYLNGEELQEDYIRDGVTPAFDFKGPYTVKDGEIFAMGDNRKWSYDCRDTGPFLVDDVVGEAVFRLFPLDVIGEI
ncbi:MAG: signal peptidase I [Clostridia bacterium]|nr:signal peptidase I [Clostridia bacterium]